MLTIKLIVSLTSRENRCVSEVSWWTTESSNDLWSRAISPHNTTLRGNFVAVHAPPFTPLHSISVLGAELLWFNSILCSVVLLMCDCHVTPSQTAGVFDNLLDPCNCLWHIYRKDCTGVDKVDCFSGQLRLRVVVIPFLTTVISNPVHLTQRFLLYLIPAVTVSKVKARRPTY